MAIRFTATVHKVATDSDGESKITLCVPLTELAALLPIVGHLKKNLRFSAIPMEMEIPMEPSEGDNH